MSSKKHGLVAAMAAVTVLLAACSQSGPQPVAAATTMSQQSSPPTTSAPRVSGASATRTPGQQRVLDANASLSTALFGMSNATAKVKTTSALGAPRKAVSDSLGATRTKLSAERTAAFGSVRNCTLVLSYAAQVRTAAAGVATARARLMQVTAAMRTQVNGLTRAVATVAAELSILQTALAAEPHPPTVVSVSQVQSAMASARTFADSTLTAAASADAKATAAVSSADNTSVQATDLATKTC